ncbi:MAG: polysaccharide biosynthesis C-terminal domain-containing protein [Defluviitaleaceae bacterium]|nr:polysaccharide biosynthesis C-terminal domain-containing protein [Defluviitaleaceae bacterium]MCL2262647.1 polysaccharide biosynthesis C-terminal domain-containing protein [Defluviitaleaceae bacterium]
MSGKAKTTENRSASDVAAISLGGRFLTFVGNTMFVGRFGTANPLLNAFTFALLLPNVIFTVLGAALNAVMIPVYNSLRAEEKQEDAKKFIDNVISISFVLLVILVTAGIVAAPWIAQIAQGDGDVAYLTFALRVLMPVMIFFGFGAIFQGLLQSHGVFRLPAFVSAPGGVILILYMIFLSERFGVNGLIFATALGFFTQPLIMINAVRRLGYRYKFSFDLKDKNIRAAGMLCVPVVISAASYQMHFLFGHTIALRLGTTAIMNYAQQLVLVFILTLVYAVAAVYLPKLSTLWAKADKAGYNENLKNAMLFTIFLVLPAACGFFLLRFEIMDFLLNWRENDGVVDIQMAGNLMGLYAVAVIAISFKEVADRAFYSVKDSKTPAIFGVIIMAVNIIATLLLVPALGAYAMPVAYGIAALTGSVGLLTILQMRTRFLDFPFILELAKTACATAITIAAAFFVLSVQFIDTAIVNLFLPAFVGVGVYFMAAYVLKISALKQLLGRVFE